MQFPIYNIDVPSLGNNFWLLNEIIRYDVFYTSNDKEIWRGFFLNKRFVDCRGDIYILVDKVKIKNFLHFLFFKNRYKCHFCATGEKINLEDLRQIIERQIENTNEKYSQPLISDLKKANTFIDLILWKTVDI